MIREGWHWKKPLLKMAERLHSLKRIGNLSEKRLTQLERDIFIGFYSVRKLIESHTKITDATKKQIAQHRRLFYKICFKCGGRNPISSERCRKCHSQKMRLKNRNIGAKK